MTDAAAILERLRVQQEAMTNLFSAVESGMADIVGGIERGNEILASLTAIEAAMADMTAALEGDGEEVKAIDRLTAAVLASKEAPEQPVVVNMDCTMPPPPAPVIHIVEPKEIGATWEVTLPGRNRGDADRVMKIVRTG